MAVRTDRQAGLQLQGHDSRLTAHCIAHAQRRAAAARGEPGCGHKGHSGGHFHDAQAHAQRSERRHAFGEPGYEYKATTQGLTGEQSRDAQTQSVWGGEQELSGCARQVRLRAQVYLGGSPHYAHAHAQSGGTRWHATTPAASTRPLGRAAFRRTGARTAQGSCTRVESPAANTGLLGQAISRRTSAHTAAIGRMKLAATGERPLGECGT
eukprot:CAMPEP_0180106596 /NCGR_PEP_ID=MMETSP0985-20121206/32781_1 /TAXON_ID=483367 /ORGANISM="non described non described, Strain CCMP 2436" /LENGTH=209 /DNA_ID=CAMNT_0022043939 /DNA_START=44 /DNA_END=674 /DNA_ORIENTATION=+